MPEEAREVSGTVLEALPGALYRVELLTDSRPRITAHLAGPALLRVLPGDDVVVELADYDTTRGRIVRRR
jgi:translation initiation factor IF-1